MEIFILIVVVTLLLGGAAYGIFWYYRKLLREAKNYERGMKMVPLKIDLPPSSDDIEGNGRDSRDVAEEAISQAQVMYSIIASTATKGFKSNMYGQRHVAFEIVATKGLIHYYVAVPLVLEDVVKQAVTAAYPTARMDQVEEQNIFSKAGKISGTIGGELSLKKSYVFPIATFQETKRDATQTILNAMANLGHEDGAAIQMLIRPARESWYKSALKEASDIRKGKKKDSGFKELINIKEVLKAFWEPPSSKEKKPEDLQLGSADQAKVEAIEEKTRHPGYETMIRVVASSNTSARSQTILKNIVSAFSLFESATRNGFKFTPARNIEAFTTSFILRFFPQTNTRLILNSVELATVLHLPDQRHTQTSQLQRQSSKQVDGPHQDLQEGFLLGYNNFRGVKKQIRLSSNDRRRHTYIIGQTGTGKSGLLENLALQDMLDGKGFAFVDPHGDSAEKLLGMVPKERVEDVIYFNPGDLENPIGLNLYEFETQDQRDFLVQEAIAMLYRLYDPGHTGIIGPRYEHWFRNASLTIMADPNGTAFIDIPQVFNDNDFTKAKLKHVTDQTVLDFWNKEMAQTSDYHKSEVLGWFVSKFGAFLSNEMMRNVIGQTKSGFNLRDIMDNKKILLVNLSKGRTGELNSQLLGMIFVMKFQAAAMGRASIPEDQRVDFTLYVDEFQNFATDSFETILSEARKYRLNLILANQFMTQLDEKIREAVIGNVGTVISGRIGVTDAELLVKKFAPVFDAEDLTKLPNFETVAVAQIDGTPSSPFSMALVPPLGTPNPQLADALKSLSAAKYGKPRKQVEAEIFKRLRAGEEDKKLRQQKALDSFSKRAGPPGGGGKPGGGSSFLDEWLSKRRKNQTPAAGAMTQPAAPRPVSSPQPQAQPLASVGRALPSPAAQPALPQPAALPQQPQASPPAQPRPVPTPVQTPSAPHGVQMTEKKFSSEGFKGVNYQPHAAGLKTDIQDGAKLEDSIAQAQAETARKQAETAKEETKNLQKQQQAAAEHHELRVRPPADADEQDGADHAREVSIDLKGNIQYIDEENSS